MASRYGFEEVKAGNEIALIEDRCNRLEGVKLVPIRYFSCVRAELAADMLGQ